MARGTRSKFGAPIFEPEVFRKQMYWIEESTYDIVGTFRRPHSHSARPAVIRRPGICAPLVHPALHPWSNPNGLLTQK